MGHLAQSACYITGAKMRARWHLVEVSTNVSRAVAPDARRPGAFFLSPFLDLSVVARG